MNEKKIVLCDCGTHGIAIVNDWEVGERTGDATIEFWFYGQQKLSLWTRLKYAWKVFMQRSVCFDEMLVSENNAKDVIIELQKIKKGKK